ncbi:hypothetical protein [sulfur-oxidizing endosymbiont of Gigantopelta aegis]|uniref:hypothetical protein n=1 Tax=sulfur-oxidizing endosymbiont of Gigantopelta aegis TaxID=2794934 RepID=UPI0018DC32A8|nr:hypothetical protein [sulfur-oxidizing endosymbiont of Gigantopelta aegis]
MDIIARFQFFIYPLIVHLSVTYKVPFVTAILLPIFYFILMQPFKEKKSHKRVSPNELKNRLESYLTVKIGLFIGEWVFRMLWFKKWFSPLRFIKQLMTIDQRELLR